MRGLIGRTGLLLSALLAVCHLQANEFDIDRWQLKTSKYEASLFFTNGDGLQLLFTYKSGSKLKGEIISSVLLTDSQSLKAFSINSPLIGKERKSLIFSANNLTSPTRSFRNSYSLKNRTQELLTVLSRGSWLAFEFKDRHGNFRHTRIPAVSFKKPWQAFNTARNKLPPINWKQARHILIKFPPSGSQLSQSARFQLQDLVRFIAYDGEITAITIDGHSDQSGDHLKNLTLSLNRAEAVRNFLIRQGLDTGIAVTVRNHGERYPIPGGTAADNRRVEIKLSRAENDSHQGQATHDG